MLPGPLPRLCAQELEVCFTQTQVDTGCFLPCFPLRGHVDVFSKEEGRMTFLCVFSCPSQLMLTSLLHSSKPPCYCDFISGQKNFLRSPLPKPLHPALRAPPFRFHFPHHFLPDLQPGSSRAITGIEGTCGLHPGQSPRGKPKLLG